MFEDEGRDETAALAGELDLSTVPELLACLEQALPPAGDFRIDVGQLTFIDGAGLHALLTLAGRIQNGRLVISGECAALERIVALLGGWAEVSPLLRSDQAGLGTPEAGTTTSTRSVNTLS